MNAVHLPKAEYMPPRPTITLEQKVALTEALNELTDFDHYYACEKTSHAIRPKSEKAGNLLLALDDKGSVISHARAVEPSELLAIDQFETVKTNLKTVFVSGMRPTLDAASAKNITRNNVTNLGYNVEFDEEVEEVISGVFEKLVNVFDEIDFSTMTILHAVNSSTYMGAEIHHLHFDMPTNNSGSLLTVTFLHKRYVQINS